MFYELSLDALVVQSSLYVKPVTHRSRCSECLESITMTTFHRAPLDADRIREAMPERTITVPYSTGSTNADLLQLAAEGAPGGSIVVTSIQNSGRGRMHRPWTAPEHANIAFSALIRADSVPLTRIGLLPLVCGLAVVDAVHEVAGIQAQLKWPNDVLVDGGKLCGILVEAASLQPPVLVAGMGLNVDLTEDELPVPHATSLRLQGASMDKEDLVIALAHALDRRTVQWRTDVRALMEEFRQNCVTVGLNVRVELPNGQEILGTATSILTDGELEVVDQSGVRHTVTAGDVRHVRPRSGGYGG